MARLDDIAIDRDVVAQFEDRDFRAKQRGCASEEERSREVDEGGPAVGDRVETKIEHGIGEQPCTREVAINTP